MVQSESQQAAAQSVTPARVRGEMAADISTAVVRIFAEWVGRGPTRARTVITDNIVTTILQETLTKAEIRLVQEGGVDAVLQMRRTHQGMMRSELMDAVEAITGRPVVAFLSDHQVEPDYASEVFVLAPDGAERLAPRRPLDLPLGKPAPPTDGIET